MISEIIIAFTLIVNACAVLNFKLKRRKDQDEFLLDSEPNFGDKIREFLIALRYFRAFIGLWNLFIMFLMIVFFGS